VADLWTARGEAGALDCVPARAERAHATIVRFVAASNTAWAWLWTIDMALSHDCVA
jgi:hypothetical protein